LHPRQHFTYASRSSNQDVVSSQLDRGRPAAGGDTQICQIGGGERRLPAAGMREKRGEHIVVYLTVSEEKA
jgi:hypothetical protein